jgi:hypothetical protein
MSTYSAFRDQPKVSLTTIPLTEAEPKEYFIGEQPILIYPIIPYEVVFIAIQEAINAIVNEYGYVSGAVYEVMTDLYVIKYFTNLDLPLDGTNPTRFYEDYDLLKPHIPAIFALIDQEQLAFYQRTLEKTIQYIISFRNSIAGILDSLKSDSLDIQRDVDTLQETVANPELLASIK